MQLEGLDKVVIARPNELGIESFWSPVTHFRRSNYEASWEPQSLGQVSQGIYRLNCTQSLKTHVFKLRRWSQFGYLTLESFGSYLDSRWLPLGQSFVYIPAGQNLSLEVKPQRYFPSIEVTLSRFSGEWAERLNRIESKLDNLVSPVDVVVNYLESEDSPLGEIQEQLEQIPEQITEQITDTFEDLLDAGETP